MSLLGLNDTADIPTRGERYGEPFFSPSLSGGSRFGHTTDFSKLFASSEEQSDYITGLVVTACFLGVILFLWFLAIVIFRCLGPNRVGFVSGSAFRRQVDPADVQKLMEDNPIDRDASGNNNNKNGDDPDSPLKYYHEGFGLGKRPSRVRVCFLFSGVVFITFSILAVTQGLLNLQTTVETVNDNAYIIDQLAIEAQEILTAVKNVRSTAVTVRNQLIESLGDGVFCPGDQSVGQSATAAMALDQAEQAVPLLTQLDDFVSDDVDEIQGAAQDVQITASDLQTDTDEVDFTSWQGLLILIPFTLIPAVLMAGTIMAMFGVEFPFLSCFMNWFAFPVFYIMVIFACICATGMLVGASVNSDFCLPGGRDNTETVDSTILRILDAEGYNTTSFEFKVARFYISSCQSGTNPFQVLRDYVPQLTDGDGALRSLLTQIRDSTARAELELYCNREFNSFELLLTNMIELIEVVLEALERTLDLASCDTILPIYASVFYDGTCKYSMSAVMWVFSGFLIASVFGLIMITLRSSYKQTVYLTPGDAMDLRLADEDSPAPGEQVVQEVDPNRSRNTIEDYGLNDSPSSGSSFGKATPY